MKIVEALKQNKDLLRKADDIRAKLREYCADMDIEKPKYTDVPTQTAQIKIWLQQHADILRQIEQNRIKIQKTNLKVPVTIEVTEGVHVTKTISEWIHRRVDLAKLERDAWFIMNSQGKKDTPYRVDAKSDKIEIAHVRLYFDQAERDKKVEEYTSEPAKINAALEVINATTDLIEE